jgi:rhamnose utilization protein RhaD (predicted bifunctional aldolase and dehydrogenase)
VASKQQVLRELVAMSRRLGEPARDYVILGEGNTSARIGESSFFVKASGAELAAITGEQFVEMDFAPTLALLEKEELSDDQIREGLLAGRAEAASTLRPSVETLFHAALLRQPGVNFVGHTHPPAVNAILCSKGAAQAFAGRTCPDEIVCCGPAPLYVPYVDPGLPLAKAIVGLVAAHRKDYGEAPRVIVMQNHGLVALGGSSREVEAVTAMWVKTCRILLGAQAFGGPSFLSPEAVSRIWTRPDEAFRRRAFVEKKTE